MTDYKRVGGFAVGGSIGWNFLRLFSTDRFDPTARPSDQISHWQSKITSDLRTKVWHGRLPPITSDYYFPPTQVLPLPDFSSDFSPDPPILWSVGQWDAGFRPLHILPSLLHSQAALPNSYPNACMPSREAGQFESIYSTKLCVFILLKLHSIYKAIILYCERKQRPNGSSNAFQILMIPHIFQTRNLYLYKMDGFMCLLSSLIISHQIINKSIKHVCSMYTEPFWRSLAMSMTLDNFWFYKHLTQTYQWACRPNKQYTLDSISNISRIMNKHRHFRNTLYVIWICIYLNLQGLHCDKFHLFIVNNKAFIENSKNREV